jgi:SAM-dependent methyltransferase
LDGAFQDIHERDLLFQYIHRIKFQGDYEKAVRDYFEDGKNCCRRFTQLCAEHKPEGVKTVLDFASGYGRVARHSAEFMPGVAWTCCDIHPEAVEFLRSHGLPAIPSTHDPQAWTSPQSYDAVLALTFFSHMPDHNFGPRLRSIFDAVAPGGIMVFTTHGEVTVQKIWKLPRSCFDSRGYYWQLGSDQPDLDRWNTGPAPSPSDMSTPFFATFPKPASSATSAASGGGTRISTSCGESSLRSQGIAST